MAFAFDTLVQSKRLREAGFDEKQAEALTGVLRDAVKPFDASELATKADLAELATATKADLKKEIASLGAATRADLALLKSELVAQIAESKASLLQWMVGWIAVALFLLNALVEIGGMFVLVKMLGR